MGFSGNLGLIIIIAWLLGDFDYHSHGRARMDIITICTAAALLWIAISH